MRTPFCRLCISSFPFHNCKIMEIEMRVILIHQVTAILSMICAPSIFFMAFPQEPDKLKFFPVAKNAIENGAFYIPLDTHVAKDVSLLSKLPKNHTPVLFDDNSNVYGVFDYYLRRFMKSQFIPDKEFIKKNSFFYSVQPNEACINTPLAKGYDVAYVAYRVENFEVLTAITEDRNFGGTYVFVTPIDKTVSKANVIKHVSTLLTSEAEKKYHLVVDAVDREKGMPVGWKMDYNIPIYLLGNTFCMFRPKYFSGDAMPSRAVGFNDWFEGIRRGDISSREWKETQIRRQALTESRKNQCKTLIATAQGRLELIGMLTSDDGKEEFGDDAYRYGKFLELPYDALFKYYFYFKHEDDEKFDGGIPVRPNEVTTSAEAEALRRLLQSDDMKLKGDAMRLIEAARSRSLLPDLLKTCHDKEQVRNLQLWYPISADPNSPQIKPRIYNFNAYRLLGWFGDAKTLASLQEIQKDATISTEVQEDIVLACEDIQRHIDEQARREQQHADEIKEMRKLIRERKLIVSPEHPFWAELNQPEPEPVSPEGFRNWETTDGLFKTTAKFAGVKGKEVQLRRQDGKTVSIELNVLRQLDQDYIREQLETAKP